MKLKPLVVLLTILLIFTACQVTTPTPFAEAEQLRQQNQLLADQLLEAQRQISNLETQVATLTAQLDSKLPEETPLPEDPNFVAGLANEVLRVLLDRDFAALATYVHPQFGVRFSPYGHINTESDLVFTRDEVVSFSLDEPVNTWGTEAGSGLNIDRNIEDYWDRYVTAQNPDPEWAVLDDPSQKASNSIDNFAEVYPEAVYLEYYQPGTEQYGFLDWRSLRLGFQRSSDGAMYLIAVIHDEWTPLTTALITQGFWNRASAIN